MFLRRSARRGTITLKPRTVQTSFLPLLLAASQCPFEKEGEGGGGGATQQLRSRPGLDALNRTLYERPNSTQARAPCRFVLFKHIEKTGGRTLVAWLAQLPWVTYVPGSYAMQLPRDVQVHPGSLKDFLQPYVRPITQSNHTEASLQLEFTSGRCGVAKNDVSAPAHGPDGCGPHGYGARASAIFSRLDCAKRCLECKGCRFASFNARAGDCSLYYLR